MDKQTRILVVRARLDPFSTIAPSYGQWCRVWHSSMKFICSRLQGHDGPHFAQYGPGDGKPGVICPCDPNPWYEEVKNG